MLDYFAIFTKGGALLWTLQFTSALKHNPLEALNALIKTCLLEERSADNAFTFSPKLGAAQSLKWTFDNVGPPGRCMLLACTQSTSASSPHHPHIRPCLFASLPLQRLGLVFVAVYQRALSLGYVDDLLASVRELFTPVYRLGVYDYSDFTATFYKAHKVRPLSSRCGAQGCVIQQPWGLTRRNGGHQEIWATRQQPGPCAIRL
jgi:signal recognition particle receptor subunit alpha